MQEHWRTNVDLIPDFSLLGRSASVGLSQGLEDHVGESVCDKNLATFGAKLGAGFQLSLAHIVSAGSSTLDQIGPASATSILIGAKLGRNPASKYAAFGHPKNRLPLATHSRTTLGDALRIVLDI